MKPTPPGWPRISIAIYYEDPARAIDWLVNAFGFEIRLKVEGEGGKILHSELTFGGGLIMVGDANRERSKWSYRRSPKSISGVNTQNIMIYVDDVEAHCEQARKAGAKIIAEPETTDRGEDYWVDRGYEAEDPEGHHFWFYQRLRTSPKQDV